MAKAKKHKTREERAWMDALSQLPCIIGSLFPQARKDCGPWLENNHLTDCGRRRGHLFTLRMCFNHHQAQSPLPVGHAYHKGHKTFVENYGSDDWLLEQQQAAVKEYLDATSIF